MQGIKFPPKDQGNDRNLLSKMLALHLLGAGNSGIKSFLSLQSRKHWKTFTTEEKIGILSKKFFVKRKLFLMTEGNRNLSTYPVTSVCEFFGVLFQR